MERFLVLSLTAAMLLTSPRLVRAEPTIEGFVESGMLPIRIYYQIDTEEELIQYTLDTSEWAYQEHIDRGWTPPYSMEEDGTPVQRLDMYLVDVPGMGSAAIGQSLANNDLTSWTDALIQILIHRGESMSTIGGTIVYGVNHAFQTSEESLETMSAYEMFDVHTTHVLLPDDFIYYYFVPGFQSEPHRAFYTHSTTNYTYHFGAALFIQFLDERYDSGDATLDAVLWRNARQDGEISLDYDGLPVSDTPNEPDILDSIRTYLQTERDTTLEEALVEFAQWRLLVGAYDDGEHFADAANLVGAEVTFAEIYLPEELPVDEAMPLSLPYPTGSSFVRIDTNEVTPETMLEVTVSLDDSTHWAAQVIRILESSPAEVVDIELVDSVGEALVPAAGAEFLVLAVTNLGDESIDSDEFPQEAEFTYSLALVTRPTVTSISPAAVTAGVRNVEVEVVASPLHEEATLDLGSGVTVSNITVEGDQLSATVDVDLMAEPGFRDVSVTNPGADPGVLEGGFEVIAPPGPTISGISPNELVQGDSGDLVITGSSFLDGAEVTLGEGIMIETVELESTTQIVLTVRVDDDAVAGPRDLTVANPGGVADTLEDAFEVIASIQEQDSGPGPNGSSAEGCSCGQAVGVKSAKRSIPLLFAALALVLIRRR